MRNSILAIAVLSLTIGSGCSSSSQPQTGSGGANAGGAGGSTTSSQGGSTSGGSGGTPAGGSGGSSSATGGTSSTSRASGGAGGTGGAVTGGTLGPTGGATQSTRTTGSGGATGGASSSSTGGASQTGGIATTGGSGSGGGSAGSGGATGSGGRTGSGGATGAGGGTSEPGAIYVAPDGDDTNPGTLDQPLKTVAKARDLVRTKNSTMTADITVYLRGGTYQQTSTLTFGNADSGKGGFYVKYLAYQNERPLITGGKPITGWKVSDATNNIYSARRGHDGVPAALRQRRQSHPRAHPESPGEQCRQLQPALRLGQDCEQPSGPELRPSRTGRISPRSRCTS